MYHASYVASATADRVEAYLFHGCDRRCVLPERTCDIRTLDATYQSLRLSGVRLWKLVTLQTL